MKKTKFYIGICLVVQCVCFAIAALILWGQKKSLAKALAITAGIGGLSGAALLALAIKESKKSTSCLDDCLDDLDEFADFDDEFFIDNEEDVYCTIDEEETANETANADASANI